MLIISTRRKPRGRPTYGDSSLRTSSIPHLPGSLFNGLPADAALTGAAFPPTVPLPDTDSIQGLAHIVLLPRVLTLTEFFIEPLEFGNEGLEVTHRDRTSQGVLPDAKQVISLLFHRVCGEGVVNHFF